MFDLEIQRVKKEVKQKPPISCVRAHARINVYISTVAVAKRSIFFIIFSMRG